MPAYRSRTTTHGRNMAGARGLWRATGMKNEDFGKPIIAVVNSFTQFVPGHVHLQNLGQLVAREIEKAGGVAKEFNTIAVDDGIAMGHDGMLYSLPSRELIADSVEYMVNAHCADAMVCISNCDKITPGMLMAAMTLDIAMGGSTNTVLHLLAAAREGEVPFTMTDIDRLSRKVPVLCKVAPSVQDVHMEDVHHAGGIMAILGELDRAKLLTTDGPTVHAATLEDALNRWDVVRTSSDKVRNFYCAAPGGVPTQEAFSQDRRFDEVDLDRAKGCIRDAAHAYSKDGGLAVLFGNLAEDGCIVKTAGVDESILKFSGPARIFESQDASVEAILGNKVKAGDVVLIRYEGPRGGPGMQEMLYPTSYLKSKGLGKACALITDGRFSGGSSGLSIGHVSPEAAEGGLIGLVEEGDVIEFDIPNRKVNLAVDDAELKRRRGAMEARGNAAWKPAAPRKRAVSTALKAYAAFASSAAKGAVRILPE